jgi:GT2 family glycosyltransferase
LSGSEPLLTVAIATYDGRELLAAALDSLATQTFRDFRVVVVDDASSDGTLEWLSDRAPDIELIVHPRNRGVTAALNTGLGAARSEFVALLNNDMELAPDCLGELVRVLRENPAAGSACPKLLRFDDRSSLDGAGDIFEWGGTAWRRGHGERDLGQYDREQPIFGACAGAAVYRRSTLDAVGLLDEDFFAFYEDVDWSFRAQLTAAGCRYVPSAVAYHIGGATLGSDVSDFMLYQNWRNALFVVFKNYPFSALLRHGPRLISTQAHNFVWAMQTKRAHVFLRVWRDTLLAMPSVLRKRRAVQRLRTVSLRELEDVIGADA